MSEAPLLGLSGVGLHYDRLHALGPLDLVLRPGEFVSLVGPSGCGKSTLLKIAAGLRAPSTGRVAPAPGAGEIGFVFQEPTLLPWANVADNAALPLRLRRAGRAERERRVAEALELVQLTPFARAYPRELSGGMQMRVSLARVLVQKPRLLLLDEPFAALDEITRFRLNDDLRRLWRHESWTVLFVTHSVFESVYLAQRVLVMTPRPGLLAAEIPVDLGEPRSSGLRTEPAYAAACRLVSERLAEAMGNAA